MRAGPGAWLVAALLAGAAAPVLSAQAAGEEPSHWTDILYPFVSYSSVDHFSVGGNYAVYSPIGFTPRPERFRASVGITGSMSAEGSYSVVLEAAAPALWDGWRLSLVAGAVRANRLGYYGLGNTTLFDEDSVTSPNPYFYAVSRSTQQLRATVQRRVIGPLRALAGVVLEHSKYRGLPGATVFEQELTSGGLDSSQAEVSDIAARLGLVFDTRDSERDPHRGVLVEGLYASGDGYTRATAHARAFVSPWERFTLAARLGGESMDGDPPLAPMTLMESSELPFVAVGGYHSLRGFYDGRFAGPGKLLGGLEARYALVWWPTVLEVKLVGFYDAARVFGPGEDFTITTDDLHSAGGAELVTRLGRNALIVLGAGFGNEGMQVVFRTGWSY